MKELVEKINAEFEVFAANAAAQVEKNNKAAGTRARKSALEISKLMKEFPQGFRRSCEIIEFRTTIKAVLRGSLYRFRFYRASSHLLSRGTNGCFILPIRAAFRSGANRRL